MAGQPLASLRLWTPAVLMGIFAGWAWYQAAIRILDRWGLGDAATAGGALVGVAVVALLWRLAARDGLREALTAGRCPSCGGALMGEHEHARAGALADGLQHWRCTDCGFQHAEALTCNQCRS